MVAVDGNQVAYGSSGGRFWTQTEVWDSGANQGTEVTVYYVYRVKTNYSMSDTSNSFSWGDPWGNGTISISVQHGGSGGTTIVHQNPNASPAGISYGSSGILTFSCSISGLGSSSGTSTSTVNYQLPARLPSPPDPPGVAVSNIGPTYATVWINVAGSENGASAQYCNYRIHRNSDGAHMGDLGGPTIGYGGVTYYNLSPGTGYTAYGQTYNSAGWSGFSAGVSFTTLPAGFANEGGIWRNSICYVNEAGVWRMAIPYVNENGIWRLA